MVKFGRLLLLPLIGGLFFASAQHANAALRYLPQPVFDPDIIGKREIQPGSYQSPGVPFREFKSWDETTLNENSGRDLKAVLKALANVTLTKNSKRVSKISVTHVSVLVPLDWTQLPLGQGKIVIRALRVDKISADVEETTTGQAQASVNCGAQIPAALTRLAPFIKAICDSNVDLSISGSNKEVSSGSGLIAAIETINSSSMRTHSFIGRWRDFNSNLVIPRETRSPNNEGLYALKFTSAPSDGGNPCAKMTLQFTGINPTRSGSQTICFQPQGDGDAVFADRNLVLVSWDSGNSVVVPLLNIYHLRARFVGGSLAYIHGDFGLEERTFSFAIN